jgi:hypothetical protein
MKTIFSILILLISLNSMSQNKYLREWKQVDSLSDIGQSQSALDIVIPIYDKTRAEGQADQFVKAMLYRMKLESDFQEDYFENGITRVQSEIQSAKSPVKQVLYSVLAELYWQYYQENRWQILNRSETSNFLPEDIKTWDVKKLVSACVENYSLSLADADILKKTPISAYNEILLKEKDSEKFRPTLFDFLIHRAIDFYSSSEAGLTKPATSFIMDKAEYFAPSKEFAGSTVSSPDPFSFEFRALKLYQEVIAFHISDTDPSALVDAELERLAFVHGKSVLPEKDDLYLAALYILENRIKNHPSSTEVAFAIASLLNGEEEDIMPYRDNDSEPVTSISESHKWDKKQAVDVCEAAISRFPDSFGAKNCLSLIESIKLPSFSIVTEYATVPALPSLALVNYKNVKKVYFRLLKPIENSGKCIRINV